MTTRFDEADMQLPDGSEVSGAVLHPTVHAPMNPSPFEPAGTPDWRSRIDHVRAAGKQRVESVMRSANRQAMAVRSSVGHSMERMSTRARSGAHDGVAKMNESMRSNPLKWAGIAAGTGLVLGLLGRLMDHREHHRSVPQLVVIETA